MTISANITPPPGFSKAQSAAFNRLAVELTAQGIDPTLRHRLIGHFVFVEHRIASLRAGEKAARGNLQMSVTRALNIAMVERRKIYRQLFAGARKPEPILPVDERDEKAFQREADAAWIKFSRNSHRNHVPGTLYEAIDLVQKSPEKIELESKYGPITFAALTEWGRLEDEDVRRARSGKNPRRSSSNHKKK